MKLAIDISIANIDNQGGPFGAVIVKNGKLVASSGNRVTALNDPTAHAEVMAIRLAASFFKNFDLSGCDIYSSCEPCPMCLGAIYWAHIDNLYYGNSSSDAAKIGFDDSFIYKELSLKKEFRRLNTSQYLEKEAIKAFEKWNLKTDRIKY